MVALERPFAHSAGYLLAVAGIYYHAGVAEEVELLVHLGFHRRKILLMGTADIGYHADGGLYDVAQCLHLAGLADACLEYSHL